MSETPASSLFGSEQNRTEPFLKYEEVEDGIVVLTMNRPDTRNALSYGEQFADFEEACARITADRGIRCAILTGAGTAFSAGGNVKQIQARAEDMAGKTYETRTGYLEGIQRIPAALYYLEVPVIAAVNGPAVGAGCDLACMCDIRIASESARFAESFVKLGIIPGDGGAWLLQRLVGPSKAAEMSFTGDMVGADEALACGLVSKVVPADQLMEASLELARRIAANPPHALRLTKRLMRESQRSTFETILQYSAAMQALAHDHENHKEAINAFLDKRKPVYTKR